MCACVAPPALSCTLPRRLAPAHRGILPRADSLEWPQEPFRSKFLGVLKRLEMPRFTRRHPQLLQSLLRQLLELVHVSFELRTATHGSSGCRCCCCCCCRPGRVHLPVSPHPPFAWLACRRLKGS